MERISSLVAIATLMAAIIFGWYQYREVHLPEFEELKIAVTYQQCIQQCVDVCRANGVPIDRCNCNHCNVYRVAGPGGLKVDDIVGPGAGIGDKGFEIARE